MRLTTEQDITICHQPGAIGSAERTTPQAQPCLQPETVDRIPSRFLAWCRKRRDECPGKNTRSRKTHAVAVIGSVRADAGSAY
jgi:hypothetical protein